MKPVVIALLAAILPFFALHLSYLHSALAGQVPTCIPYLEGCTSISRAARRGDTIFIFRAIMMPYAFVLIVFWAMCQTWLEKLLLLPSHRPLLMKLIGWLGALALLLYVDFLGTEGEWYRFMRRYGVIFFFSFTALSQLLLTSCLYQITEFQHHSVLWFRKVMFGVCLALLFLAFTHLWASLLENGDRYENMVEWNFGLLLILFGAVSWQAWRATGFDCSFTISRT